MLFARSHIEIVDWKLSKRSSRLFLKNERTVFEMAPREIIGIGSKVTIVEGKIGDGKWRSRFYIRREVSRIRGKKRETSDVSTNKKRKKERRKKKKWRDLLCGGDTIIRPSPFLSHFSLREDSQSGKKEILSTNTLEFPSFPVEYIHFVSTLQSRV